MPPAKLPLPVQLRGVRAMATTAGSRPALSGLSAAARSKAEKISQEWKGTSATGANTKNFVGGEFVESKAEKWIDVVDPVRMRMLVFDCSDGRALFIGFPNALDQSAGDYFG